MILKLPELTTLNKFISAQNHNRFAGAKIKKDLTELVAWECKAQGLKPIKTIGSITFTWLETNKRRDPDNISFGTKFIFDGLIMAGIIKNDGWKLFYNNPMITHLFEISDKRGCIVKFEL